MMFVLKLVAKELGIPKEVIEEMKGARIDVVESEVCVVGQRIYGGLTGDVPGVIEWPGVCVKMLITSDSLETFPVTVSIPNLIMDRLPVSVRAKICEVALG